MKKLIIIIALAILLASCSKDEPVTTYYVVNNMPVSNSSIEYLDGSLWEVVVYCFDSTGDIVRQDDLDPVRSGGGESIKTEVTSNIIKVVVSFKLLPPKSAYYELSTNVRKYTVVKFVLTPGIDNKIEINGNTTIGNSVASAINNQTLISFSQQFYNL